MTVARADAGQAKTDPTPASVVTLVHGTFARGSRWRDLERRLQSTLPAPVIFEYFEWTGGFTVRARARASIELREDLRHRFAQHDRADHYIVAHSHGGNVVLSALDPNVAGSEFSKRVKMVICLSTPFLTVYPRASRAPEYFAVLGLLAWSFVALRDRPALFLWAALPLVIALALVLFELRSRANRIASTMWRDVSASLPLRVLRSAADEAALILALAQAITGVLRRLVDALVAIPRGAERFALWTWEVFGDVLLALARPEGPSPHISGTGLLILPLSMLGLALSTWLAFTVRLALWHPLDRRRTPGPGHHADLGLGARHRPAASRIDHRRTAHLHRPVAALSPRWRATRTCRRISECGRRAEPGGHVDRASAAMALGGRRAGAPAQRVVRRPESFAADPRLAGRVSGTDRASNQLRAASNVCASCLWPLCLAGILAIY